MYKNENCEIYGTALCRYAGSEGCDTCNMNYTPKHPGEREIAAREFEVGVAFLPDDVDKLHTSEKCLLCKDETVNDTSCYIIADMAHPEPERRKGVLLGFGKKLRTEVGSLLQIPIACCSRCRWNYRKQIYARWIGVLLSITLALMVFVIDPINQTLQGISEYMPLIVSAVVAITGITLSFLIAKIIHSNAEEHTELNIFNIPILSQMKENGWFLLGDSGKGRDDSSLLFSNSKPKPNLRFK